MTEHTSPAPIAALIAASVRDATGTCQIDHHWCRTHDSYAPAPMCDAMADYLDVAVNAVRVVLEGVITGINKARDLTGAPGLDDFARGVDRGFAVTAEMLRAIIDGLSA